MVSQTKKENSDALVTPEEVGTDKSFESYVLGDARFYVRMEGFKAIINGKADDISIDVIEDSEYVDIRWAGPYDTRVEQAIIEGEIHAVCPMILERDDGYHGRENGFYMNAHVYNLYGRELDQQPAVGLAYDDYWENFEERVEQEDKPFHLSFEGHEVV